MCDILELRNQTKMILTSVLRRVASWLQNPFQNVGSAHQRTSKICLPMFNICFHLLPWWSPSTLTCGNHLHPLQLHVRFSQGFGLAVPEHQSHGYQPLHPSQIALDVVSHCKGEGYVQYPNAMHDITTSSLCIPLYAHDIPTKRFVWCSDRYCWWWNHTILQYISPWDPHLSIIRHQSPFFVT